MDEPSLGLAPMLVSQLFDTIRQVNEAGLTILLVEQNCRMSLKIAHQGYVLETGTVVLGGTGEELACDPRVQQAYMGT
jgi:branched-chain amino acid transport system ATP-binding protein